MAADLRQVLVGLLSSERLIDSSIPEVLCDTSGKVGVA